MIAGKYDYYYGVVREKRPDGVSGLIAKVFSVKRGEKPENDNLTYSVYGKQVAEQECRKLNAGLMASGEYLYKLPSAPLNTKKGEHYES